ncbi:putative solute carrier family 35 member G1 [Apostichopus japonicus]|uniref:Putative solute carrier family 35 member G1 n=1 Tax=Stichopus japonicus TaxID=307972 RepID=A0A2G8JQ39_STIJA|nr:putative solute carrier family 35 member G1 [Apostichopus japonicus]
MAVVNNSLDTASEIRPPEESAMAEESSETNWKRKLSDNRGVFLTLLAAFLFSLKTVMFRFVEEDVHVMQISFSLLSIQIFFIIPVMVYKGTSPKISSLNVFVLLFFRAFSGTLAVCLFYYAIDHMRLGDVTAIALSAPVFVGIFAKLILKETFGYVDCILVMVVIAGVVLISQPQFIFRGRIDNDVDDVTNFTATLAAVGCCLSLAMTYVINRKMGLLKVHSFVIVFYYIIFASVGLGVVTTIFRSWSIPACGTVRYAFIAMALSAFIAQTLMTYSLSITNSFVVSIVHSNEIIFAYFWEFFLFRVSPEILSLLGVVLVMTASSITSLRKIGFQRTQQQRRTDKMDETEGSNQSLGENISVL